MMKAYLERGSDEPDGFEFLTMAEAARTLRQSGAVALGCALLAAGCGGEPNIRSDLGGQLAARADAAAARLESGEHCAAQADVRALQGRAIAAVNAGRVPPELQEELLGSANALVEGVSCTPPRADVGAAADARELADWLRERSEPPD